MTCKDCIHQEACLDWCRGFGEEAEKCEHFKDKSLFVELPCKVGDTVYEVKPYLKSHQKKHPGDKGYIVTSVVKGIHKHTSQNYKNPNQIYSYLVCENPVMSGYFKRYLFEKIGKTVFLTREEAEQALRGMK